VPSTGTANAPEWSPDGTRLIYVAGVKGRNEVWSTVLDGSAPPSRLVEIDGEVISAVPTPDGRSLIVSRWAKGDSRIELLRVALDGSRTDTLVSPMGANVVRPISPRVSPDGRLVAFGDRSRRSVRVQDMHGKADIEISATGGCCPLWGPDSRRVFFQDGSRLIAVDLQTEPTLRVMGRNASEGFWAAGAIATTYEDVWYDLSPDGRTFVAVTPIRTHTRVFAVYNWAEEMRREWKAGSRK